MMLNRSTQNEVDECIAGCLPEFSHINHYWDRQREMVIAKILPGEFYMTTEHVAIATTLGSCISACIWDEITGIGGMNHFMLPTTDMDVKDVNWGQRGLVTDATRYGNYAMEHLINMILRHGGRRTNLRAKVFGGGKVLKKVSDVGQRNLTFALSYLKAENIFVEASDLGNIFPRKVIFEPSTGRAFVKRLDNLHNDTIARRENDYSRQLSKDDIDGDVELF